MKNAKMEAEKNVDNIDKALILALKQSSSQIKEKFMIALDSLDKTSRQMCKIWETDDLDISNPCVISEGIQIVQKYLHQQPNIWNLVDTFGNIFGMDKFSYKYVQDFFDSSDNDQLVKLPEFLYTGPIESALTQTSKAWINHVVGFHRISLHLGMPNDMSMPPVLRNFTQNILYLTAKELIVDLSFYMTVEKERSKYQTILLQSSQKEANYFKNQLLELKKELETATKSWNRKGKKFRAKYHFCGPLPHQEIYSLIEELLQETSNPSIYFQLKNSFYQSCNAPLHENGDRKLYIGMAVYSDLVGQLISDYHVENFEKCVKIVEEASEKRKKNTEEKELLSSYTGWKLNVVINNWFDDSFETLCQEFQDGIFIDPYSFRIQRSDSPIHLTLMFLKSYVVIGILFYLFPKMFITFYVFILTFIPSTKHFIHNGCTCMFKKLNVELIDLYYHQKHFSK